MHDAKLNVNKSLQFLLWLTEQRLFGCARNEKYVGVLKTRTKLHFRKKISNIKYMFIYLFISCLSSNRGNLQRRKSKIEGYLYFP